MNPDNQFATGRRTVDTGKVPIVFMTRSNVDALLRREEEKALISSTRLHLKPLYAVGVAIKLYLVGYITPQVQKFDGSNGNTREHVVFFSSANNVVLCMREFSKPLTDQTYTWNINLK